MKDNIDSFLNIAEIHVKRLQFAIDNLASNMPIDEKVVSNMPDQVFLYLEVLTNRFSKLQDFLGSKIFDLCLELYKENYTGMTMNDKLNKLEKIGIIESSEFWDKLRALKNNLTHEYPNHPELTAKYLNNTYLLSRQLIALTNKTIKSINSI